MIMIYDMVFPSHIRKRMYRIVKKYIKMILCCYSCTEIAICFAHPFYEIFYVCIFMLCIISFLDMLLLLYVAIILLKRVTCR